jgi:hypothetical protein
MGFIYFPFTVVSELLFITSGVHWSRLQWYANSVQCVSKFSPLHAFPYYNRNIYQIITIHCQYSAHL